MSTEKSSWTTPITLAAADRAAVEWKHFHESTYWDEEQALGDLITKFVELFGDGLRGISHCENFDNETVTLIAMVGIEQTGMYTFEEIEAALGRNPPVGSPSH